MASTEVLAPAPEPEKTVPPPEAPVVEVEAPPPAPPPETKAAEPAPPPDYLVVADVVLRVVLFAAALTSVVVMVTSNQTKLIPQAFPPFSTVARPAKFNHSSAFIYFVVALSVAGLYSIITAAVSFFALLKPDCTSKLLAHFIISDVLILAIVAAATGAAGAEAYIGLHGNSHTGWGKVCNVYDKFCQRVGASIFVSLVASIVLVLLVILSAYSLSKKIPQ